MAFPVKLDRPYVIFDIEATGLSVRADRIIELAAVRIDPDGRETRKCWLLNPTIPIPVETTAIHGIDDEAVKDCPTFADKALEIFMFFEGADLGGFNAGHFDVPLLAEEFARCGMNFDPEGRRLLDAQRIFHLREPRDLSAALQFYCGRAHEGAHGAEADVEATLAVLRGQFERYADLPRTMAELDRQLNPLDPFNADRRGLLRWVNGVLQINFGKKKGTPLADAAKNDPGFLKWIIKNDFPRDTREICERALAGSFPSAPQPRAEERK